MSSTNYRIIIEEILAAIDIPDSAYDKAARRYKDLGEWFNRAESLCAPHNPHIYPQGSFRLGTVIRSDEFDLDVGCRLCSGISKMSHTQKQLKQLVGCEMEAYRIARRIKEQLEEKHRCWRLPYSDEFKFHEDVVPSIPEDTTQRQALRLAMIKTGSAEAVAQTVAEFAGAITDKRDPNYDKVSAAWRISNSEGYALWFEARMKQTKALMEKHALAAKAQVDNLPIPRRKLPLQQSVQLLKHHRDEMFADDPDGKPISVIITTLAALAYQGEAEIDDAVERILTDMDKYIRSTVPRVPNPVNPAEDFADKWSDPNYRHFNFEHNFREWLDSARRDFGLISSTRDIEMLVEQAHHKFGAAVSRKNLEERLGWPSIESKPKVHQVTERPAKPWRWA
jgi:hypothetical protein